MAPKHLIVCSDGTWQKINKTYPTNVVKTKRVIEGAGQSDQRLFYDPGVGTSNPIAKLFGGAFGSGLRRNIRQCYEFLCDNYTPGDKIYLFGFSRGAYTVRSLAGLIYKCGLVRTGKGRHIRKAFRFYRDTDVKPNSKEAIAFRVRYAHHSTETDNRAWITFLGCWDTVGSLGVPDLNPKFELDTKINRKHQFHDTDLSFIVKHARHAVAIDERRKVFDVTPMTLSSRAKDLTDLKQMWFSGDHGCVGGGELVKEPLSNITFNWMMAELQALQSESDLHIDMSAVPREGDLDYKASFDNSVTGMYKKIGEIDRAVPENFDALHWSVKARLKEVASYNPASIRMLFATVIPHWSLKRSQTDLV